jgi:TPR repeat protein
MSHRTSIHIAFIAALMFAATSPAMGAEPAQMDAAHQSYHLGQYQRSLALYELLAAQGHAEAAERAGYMLMMGPIAYGAQVPRNVTRATELLEQAAMAGRQHAFFLLEMAGQAD